jgi:hypothetical protein
MNFPGHASLLGDIYQSTIYPAGILTIESVTFLEELLNTADNAYTYPWNNNKGYKENP